MLGHMSDAPAEQHTEDRAAQDSDPTTTHPKLVQPKGLTELQWFQNMVDSNWAIVKELQEFVGVTRASNERTAASTERAIGVSRIGYVAVIVLTITMVGSWGLIYASAIRNAEAREEVLTQALMHCMGNAAPLPPAKLGPN